MKRSKASTAPPRLSRRGREAFRAYASAIMREGPLRLKVTKCFAIVTLFEAEALANADIGRGVPAETAYRRAIERTIKRLKGKNVLEKYVKKA